MGTRISRLSSIHSGYNNILKVPMAYFIHKTHILNNDIDIVVSIYRRACINT